MPNLHCFFNNFTAKTKFFTISIVVLIYAILCGFTVSVTRALIMTVVLLYVKMRQFDYDGLNSLSLAGLIILLLEPLWLFDAGFQLSFLAVAGIIVLSPLISRFLCRYFNDKFANTIAVCVSAQVATLPVIMTTISNLSS